MHLSHIPDGFVYIKITSPNGNHTDGLIKPTGAEIDISLLQDVVIKPVEGKDKDNTENAEVQGLEPE